MLFKKGMVMKKQYILIVALCTMITIDVGSMYGYKNLPWSQIRQEMVRRSFSTEPMRQQITQTNSRYFNQFKNWFNQLFSRRTAFTTGAATGMAAGGYATYQLTKPVINPHQQEFINNQLIIAASSGNIQAMQEALKAGAKIDAQDASGRTALMEAASTDASKLLLDSNANPHIKDKKGMTAQDIAQERGNKNKVSFMRYYNMNKALDTIGKGFQWFRGERAE